MTAYPDPTHLTAYSAQRMNQGLPLHPDVREEFWGYTLRMTERSVSAATVVRAMSGLGFVVFLSATISVWMLKSAGLAGSGSGLLPAVLVTLGWISWSVFRRATPVRVQIDTYAGELREVIDLPFGGVEVLACHGFDAVLDVCVVASTLKDGFGQIRVSFADSETVPVAAGAISALRPLRDRLAQDMGVEAEQRREAVWSGPLAA